MIKILAIDDEQDILYTLKAIGAAMKWKVHAETNSAQAFRRIAAVKPDIILIDYHMPQQDGLTTVRQIRRADKMIPIIVLTVDERQEIANQFLSAGASDFATKPIKIPDLAARIHVHIKLLRKRKETELQYQVDKGINQATLQLIYEYCCSVNNWFLVKDVAQHVGLAYQTTVRYLQYLHSRKELMVKSEYGKIGRPRNKYKVIDK